MDQRAIKEASGGGGRFERPVCAHRIRAALRRLQPLCDELAGVRAHWFRMERSPARGLISRTGYR